MRCRLRRLVAAQMVHCFRFAGASAQGHCCGHQGLRRRDAVTARIGSSGIGTLRVSDLNSPLAQLRIIFYFGLQNLTNCLCQNKISPLRQFQFILVDGQTIYHMV